MKMKEYFLFTYFLHSIIALSLLNKERMKQIDEEEIWANDSQGVDISTYNNKNISIKLYIKNEPLSSIYIVPDIASCTGIGKSPGYCGYAFSAVLPYIPVTWKLIKKENYYCIRSIDDEHVFLSIEQIEGKNCDIQDEYCKLIKLVRLEKNDECNDPLYDSRWTINSSDQGTFNIVPFAFQYAYLTVEEIPDVNFTSRNSLVAVSYLEPPILTQGKPYVFFQFQTCNYKYSVNCFVKLDFTKLFTTGNNYVNILIQTEYYLNEKFNRVVPFTNLVKAGSSMGNLGNFVVNSDAFGTSPSYKFDLRNSIMKAFYTYRMATNDYVFDAYWRDGSPVIFDSRAAHYHINCDYQLKKVLIKTCRFDSSLFEIRSLCPEESPLYFRNTWEHLSSTSAEIKTPIICFNIWFSPPEEQIKLANSSTATLAETAAAQTTSASTTTTTTPT